MQVRQGLAKGLGHAVLCAHPVVGDEPVAVILPDVILDEYESDLSQDNLAEMIRRFDETGHSQIMVEPVADVTAYGVVDCKGVELAPGESVPMVGVVEKPKADVAPSNLAIVVVTYLVRIFGRCWQKPLRELVMKFSSPTQLIC